MVILILATVIYYVTLCRQASGNSWGIPGRAGLAGKILGTGDRKSQVRDELYKTVKNVPKYRNLDISIVRHEKSKNPSTDKFLGLEISSK